MRQNSQSIRRSIAAFLLVCGALSLALINSRPGTGATTQGPADSATGKNFLPSRTYPLDEDRALLKAFDGLRVADVSDGMDAVGLQDVGLMEPRIAPLWRDLDSFAHRICGVAVTVRYVPTNRRASRVSAEEFKKFEGRWYRELSPEPFVELLREGSVVIIDGHEDGDTGTIGSNNIMLWKTCGAVGVVTSGGARDTDEIIKQKVPLYFRGPRPGSTPRRPDVGM
jgi:4-hydroxy-4-methyl-2-oxoglutarate aldolase